MNRLSIPEFEKSTSILTKCDYDEYNAVYCLLRAVFPKEQNSHFETLKKKYFNKLKFPKGALPLNISNLRYFVEQNSWLNITVKVLYYKNGVCYPKEFLGNGKQTVCLIYVKHINGISLQSHFFLLKKPDAFLSRKYKNGNKDTKKLFFCLNCLCKFSQEIDRNKHEMHCSTVNRAQRVVMPKGQNGEKPFLAFKNYKATCLSPIVCFADFESCLTRLQGKICSQCNHELCVCEMSVTSKLNMHVPVSWCLIIVTSEGNVIQEEICTGDNVVPKFFEFLIKAEPAIKEYRQRFKDHMFPLSELQEKSYEAATHCYICNKPFLQDGDGKVHDQ